MKWTIRLALGLITAILVLAVGLLGYRTYKQHENAVAFAIHTPNGIQESGFVKIGGIDQFIMIRGEDRNNPVILLLHGGPGLAQSLLFAWFRPWEKYFTVAQWDQRGAGKTYGRYGKATPDLTVERIVADGIEVRSYLREHLRTDKIILIGHSWGSQIGLQMIAQRPDLYAAYVGTGQEVDDVKAETIDYNMVLEAAQRAGDKKAVAALKQIGPPPYADPKSMLVERSAAAPYGPANEQPMNYYKRSLPTALFAPGFTLKDIYDASYGGLYSLGVLTWRLNTFDARKVSLAYQVPLYFFQGDHDVTTPSSLIDQYIADIVAPHKELVVLKGDGHGAILTDPDQFLGALLAHVRPAVVEAQTN